MEKKVSITAAIKQFYRHAKPRRIIAFLSAVVVFFTMNTFMVDTKAQGRIAHCGLEEHVHDRSCQDANRRLVCDKEEHIHAEACYKARPGKTELQVLDENGEHDSPASLADPLDADEVDIVSEDIETPIEEMIVDLLEAAANGNGLSDGDADGLSNILTYDLDGSEVFLSDILNAVDREIAGILEVGEIEDDAFVDEHIEVEPVKGVEDEYTIRVKKDFDAIELSVANEEETISIYLLNGKAVNAAPGGKDIPEEGKTTETDGVFTTTSFSAFTGAYTVDFHYEGVGFSIRGGSGLWLSALAQELGLDRIEGFAAEAIESVSFSNPALIEVSQSVNEDGEPDWLLRSLGAFDTVETLTIALHDGRSILVDVTDDPSDSLEDFLTDAVLYVDGVAYSLKNGGWPSVYKDVDYDLRLSFAERGLHQFPSSGDSLMMAVPDGLDIDADLSATFDINGGLAGKVTGNRMEIVDFGGDKFFKLTFGSDPNDILTRSSNTRFNVDITARFVKEVSEIHFTDSVQGEVDISTDGEATVTKSGFYNQSTGKMEYTLTVSSRGTTEDIHIVDTISGDTLTYDDNASIVPSDTQLSEGITKVGNGFELTIAQMNDGDTVTISYTASVAYAELENLTIKESDRKNSVVYTYKDEPGKTTEFSYDNKIWYSNINKSNAYVEEDGCNKKLTWRIVANDNFRSSIVGGTISDQIAWESAAAMKYSDPLVLKVVARDSDGNQVGKEQITLTEDTVNGSYLWKNGQTGQEGWIYTIPSFGEAPGTPLSYEITYTTVVDPAEVPSDGIVRNDSYNDHGGSSGGTGSIQMPNPETINAVKTAKKVTDAYVDWDILITVPDEGFPNGLEIVDDLPYQWGEFTLADTLAEESPISVSGLVEGEHWEMTTEEIFRPGYNNGRPAAITPEMAITCFRRRNTTQAGCLRICLPLRRIPTAAQPSIRTM